MKERPILFNGDMVRAILEGKKTQTRRIVKPQPIWCGTSKTFEWDAANEYGYIPVGEMDSFCPFGSEGDRLWVRESWYECINNNDKIHYAADGFPPITDRRHYKKRPSIHMPRWASRITMEITKVRVERLQDISIHDAISEGIEQFNGFSGDGQLAWKDYLGVEGIAYDFGQGAIKSFHSLWNSIYGLESWDLNPWVWVVEFRRL